MAAAKVGSAREPEEWTEATQKSRAALTNVGGQARDLLVEGDITGGRPLLSQRLREAGEAERSGEVALVRAAYMNAAVAFLAMAASIDIRHPDLMAPRPRRPRAVA